MNYQFRGFSLRENRWVHGSLIERSAHYGSHYSILECAVDRDDEDQEIEVYYPSCGQYTGLKDKNGRTIYEGDICKAYKPNSYLDGVYEVIWDEKKGRWAYRGNNYQVGCQGNLKCEVIGNVYQNPNLLK